MAGTARGWKEPEDTLSKAGTLMSQLDVVQGDVRCQILQPVGEICCCVRSSWRAGEQV